MTSLQEESGKEVDERSAFVSLSRPERVERLSRMPVQKARESLYSYYAGMESEDQQNEYDAMMEVINAREAEEAERIAAKEAEEAAAKLAQETQTAAAREAAEKIMREEAERARLEEERRRAEEEEERRRLAEEEKIAIAIDTFKGAMAKRTDSIRKLLEDEEIYVHNITAVADYLAQLVSRRRRLSKRHSRGLPAFDPSVDPSLSISISGSPGNSPTTPLYATHTDLYAPKQGETMTAAEIRVETENEELGVLHRVVEDLVGLHEGLITDIRLCFQEAQVPINVDGRRSYGNDDEIDPDVLEEDGLLIPLGEALMRFAAGAMSPYVTYSVVALQSGNSSATSLEVLDRWAGKNPKSTGSDFVSKVVNKFLGEKYRRDGGVGAASYSDETAWQWYLSRPLKRLMEYGAVFEEIKSVKYLGNAGMPVKMKEVKGSSPLEKEQRRAIRDDRRLQVAAVKLDCVGRAIMNKLDLDV
ncbi:hypothetical protein HDU76_008197 [Blyttiomyces sp. JEL0837]|nr:hypothetical protein HDU76_008197 [Blyttiomyces sp. JEL0837]